MKVLIAGANSDVSRELLNLFAAEGDELILLSRDVENLELLKKDIETRYENVKVEVDYLDVTDKNSFNPIFDKFKEVDCLIYIAGYLGDNERALLDMEEAERILNTNFTGAVLFINHFAMEFAKRGSGIIVGFSSVAGDRGKSSNFIYGSAKGGFSVYLQGLRNYLFKKGVKVLTVKPGFIATKMTENMDLPKALTASPEKVAKDVFKAIKKGRDVVYTRWFWKFIMLVIKLIPERIFKKMSM